MKKLFYAVFVSTISFIAHSQEIIKETRQVSGIKQVKISSGIDLYLSQGGSEKMRIEIPKDRMDKFRADVKNGMLEIYFEKNNWSWSWNSNNNNNTPKVYLTFKDLDEIIANGGSDVFSESRLLFDNVKLAANGGSDMRLDFSAEAVDCSATGGSDAILTGSARYFKGTVSGGSDLKAKDLHTLSAKISASGGSDAFIWVDKDLSANASGGSDIYYYGKPKNVNDSTSGGSDIHRK